MKLSLYLVVLATIFIHAKAAPEVNFDAQESVQRSSGQHEWEHNGAGDGSETISESALSHESAKIGDGSSNGSGMAANSKKSGSCRGTGGMSVSVCKSRKESVEGQGERNGIRTVTIDISGSQVADRGSCSGNASLVLNCDARGSTGSSSIQHGSENNGQISQESLSSHSGSLLVDRSGSGRVNSADKEAYSPTDQTITNQYQSKSMRSDATANSTLRGSGDASGTRSGLVESGRGIGDMSVSLSGSRKGSVDGKGF
ncbi:hornerin-like [Belonocnema kinseyi]|uniref:hornerin-like n=1 Tax=Belonocnema kinseyi TaxID=2817044 RepID=UPI00143D4571|nr:hornerin-like [Belonocnema kinseyi]